MNNTAKAREIIERCWDGVPQKEIGRWSSRTVRRLVDNGFLRRERARPTGKRGGPGWIIFSVRKIPLPEYLVKKRRQHPLVDQVIGLIGDGELPLREIADALGKPSPQISGMMARLCAQGVLCRRRMQGTLRGMTSVREWYVYRVATAP
jgi:DNA-binding MarR family transcriptional regulator